MNLSMVAKQLIATLGAGDAISRVSRTPRVVWAVSEFVLDTRGRKPIGMLEFVHATRNWPLSIKSAIALNARHVAMS